MRKISGTHFYANIHGNDINLGDIYQKDGNDFILLMNLFQEFNLTDINEFVNKSGKQRMIYTKDSGVSLNFESRSRIPVAEGEVHIKFEKQRAALITLEDAQTHSLKMAKLTKKLMKIWDDYEYIKDVRNHVIVSELVKARSGRIIYSNSKGVTAKLSASNNEITGIEDLFNANLQLNFNSSSIIEIVPQQTSELMVSMLRYHKNKRRRKFRYI